MKNDKDILELIKKEILESFAEMEEKFFMKYDESKQRDMTEDEIAESEKSCNKFM